MRLRWPVLAFALLLLATACGGGKSSTSGSGNGLGGPTTTAAAQTSVCKTAALESTEVGVSPTSITVTVIADVQNGFRPGLFQGSWDGVKAWGDWVNSRGGLACRHVIVKEADSKLSPTDASNALAAACTNSIATVGTTALFLQNFDTLNSCKDKAGKATGLPDVAELQTESGQQCSPVSFAVVPGGSCPYSGTGKRTFLISRTTSDYYFSKFGAHVLHGVFVIPKDTPSTIASSTPLFRAQNRLGITSDAEFGISGTAIQTDYTPIVQAMKSHNSTFARNGIDYKGTVLMRKEAQAQGVNTVKVWDCSLQCYDKRLISEGGSAVENQYVWLGFLPFEDKGTNAALDAFLKYDKSPDGFGAQGFVAALAFERAVNDAMKANNDDPNAVTRTNILTALRNLHDFDAGGLISKTDIGNHTASTCLIGLQVQSGKFVRVDPPAPGQFDCDDNRPPLSLVIDPVAEYHG